MDAIDFALKYFEKSMRDGEDIREHLPTLKNYASLCDSVTEMGVRGIVSTWAFVTAVPKKLVCIDIVMPSFFLHDGEKTLESLSNVCDDLGIEFSFVLGDSLKLEIEETDLLFIDTIHTYAQLSQELKLHANKVKKWIIIHDTESCKDYINDSAGNLVGGLGLAIDEFLKNNPEWEVREIYTNNNGLTVLERKYD